MIKTVIFDIDNTLYCFDVAHAVAYPKIKAYARDNLGIEESRFGDISKEATDLIRTQVGDTAPIHSRLIRFQNIIEERDMPLQPHAVAMEKLYWRTLIDNMQPSPGAEDTMRELKNRGIRIGIGSDMTSYIQFKKLEKLNLLQYIDFMVCSEEAGAEKPSAQFFDVVGRKARCDRKQCVFVGDHYKKDYMGSINAGMHGIWYNPKNEDAPEKSDTDVIFVTRLDEILNIIDKFDVGE